MTEQGFIPLSSQLGIPGTSYRIQLGLINDKWASRLLKGNDILDSYVYKDEDVGEQGFPNQNMIVGWVLRTIAIPNINPHQIMKTTQVLVKQAQQKKEQQKVIAPVSETRDVELEKVPENELKRPKVQGWVKEEGMKSADELEAEKREAFQIRLAAKKEEERMKESAGSTVKTTRQLPSIPKAQETETKKFCPSCGKDLDWKFCPYCGKPLP
ncbi:MAG: zinc ribbon domain-containing protein [Candidatus Lokiarchaeota archaeon]|nr:zinc ribbon domain-containing protein [Candidatus Lokiarchaeota archaeon]